MDPLKRQVINSLHQWGCGTWAKNRMHWEMSDNQKSKRGCTRSCTIWYTSLTGYLQIRQISAKLMFCLLTLKQTNNCMSVFGDLFEQAKNYLNCMSLIVIGDWTCMYGYNQETKQMSSQWQMVSSPQPKKSQQMNSTVKNLLCSLTLMGWFIPRGPSVNAELYKPVLWHCRHHPENWRTNNWMLCIWLSPYLQICHHKHIFA